MSKSKRFGKALSWLGRTGFRVVRQMMAPSISVFSYSTRHQHVVDHVAVHPAVPNVCHLRSLESDRVVAPLAEPLHLTATIRPAEGFPSEFRQRLTVQPDNAKVSRLAAAVSALLGDRVDARTFHSILQPEFYCFVFFYQVDQFLCAFDLSIT